MTSGDIWREKVLPHHADLISASAISPEVAIARGYRSVTTQAELRRLGFGDAHRRVPALLIPIYGPTGEIATYQIRPDEPRVRNGKAIKYETPTGNRMVLDVPPAVRDGLGNPHQLLIVTEGVRKADSAASHDLCCIDVLGVWNWRGTNERGGSVALADWESVALKGRDVLLAFDSDVMLKPAVHAALGRLGAFLSNRGATIRYVYVPSGDGGAKVGLDDFLAAGHDVDELLALASPELRRCPADESDDAPYAATPSGLVWRKPTQNGAVPVPLTNFTAAIMRDVVEDDGAEARRLFELEATLHGRTRRVSVPAAQFPGLGWVPDKLGAGAVVAPGMGLKDHARAAIQLLSGAVAEHHVYAHTGWRRIGDEWVYLHAGGGIGRDGSVSGVEVALVGPLGRFRLPDPPAGEDLIRAVRASLSLRELLPPDVAVPLLGATYEAPLREALGEEGPDYVPWFHGPSGAFKSELIALAQAHYGNFTRQSLPVSFAATANAVERVAFSAKDAILAVDDYHPAGDLREAQAMAQVAGRLLRGTGNAAGRDRMRADTTLRPALFPRCIPIVSGERLPVGHSTIARMFPIPVAPDAIDLDRLTAAQDRRPCYARAMAAYVRWLAGQLDDLRLTLPGRYRELRREAQRAGGHRREPGQLAHLVLGLDVFLGFAVEVGAIPTAERDCVIGDAWDLLLAHAAEHGEAQAEEAPHQIFLRLVADGFAGKRAYLEARGGGAPSDAERWGWEAIVRTDREGEKIQEMRHGPAAALLGAVDDDWLMLYPEATYQFVAGAARAAGRAFPVDAKMLLKRLAEAGVIATEEGGRRRTVNVWTGQATRRVIKLWRGALEPSPPGQDGEVREDGEGDSQSPVETGTFPSRNGTDLSRSGNEHREGSVDLTARLPGLPPIPDLPRPSQEESVSPGGEEVVEWTAVP